jgi:homoserine dehydrogenase
MPAMPRVARSAPLRIALLGLGTVGREVARGLLERADHLEAAAGRPLRLTAIGVREPHRDRGLRMADGVILTDDLEGLATSREADVVVELLGGLEPAGRLVRTALEAGRAVVTANKALLARQGVELEACSRSRSAPLRFEAAVAGGVPLLAPLARDLAANQWSQLAGIVNGTTNHILTAMTEEGRAYPDVLVDAQARGYAEADPSGDVEGRDAADKLTLLCRLAFGAWIHVDRIPRALPGSSEPGITGITAGEIAEAAGHGLVLKLIAAASRTDGQLAASVRPTAVAAASPLGSTGGVTNMVVLRGEPIGEVRFAGPGAGGAATSSAVLGDLLAIARGEGSTWAALPPAEPEELAALPTMDRAGRTLGRYPVLELPA